MIVRLSVFILFFCFSSTNIGAFSSVNSEQEEWLVVSNSPEEITEPGVIFDETIHTENIRLLYHHKNGGEKTFFLRLDIENPHDDSLSILLRKGIAGPNQDGIYVGHRATKEYMTHVRQRNFQEFIASFCFSIANCLYRKNFISRQSKTI